MTVPHQLFNENSIFLSIQFFPEIETCFPHIFPFPFRWFYSIMLTPRIINVWLEWEEHVEKNIYHWTTVQSMQNRTPAQPLCKNGHLCPACLVLLCPVLYLQHSKCPVLYHLSNQRATGFNSDYGSEDSDSESGWGYSSSKPQCRDGSSEPVSGSVDIVS